MGGPFYPNPANPTSFYPTPKMPQSKERKRAANAAAWALGRQQRNGFHVRKVVWGLLMAHAERREGEEIRAATILVGPKR